MKEIILVGFGGHAKSVIDSIEKSREYEIIGYTDVEPNKEYKSYQYLGDDGVLQQYYDKGVHYAFIAVGYMGKGDLRAKLYEKVKKIGYVIPSIIDISAQLAADVRIDEGCFVGKRAVINANASVGKMGIINTGAIVEHDCSVGEFTHISVGSILCGNVKVGNSSFIGANATVIQGREIGNECIVAAGVVVRKNIKDGMLIKD